VQREACIQDVRARIDRQTVEESKAGVALGRTGHQQAIVSATGAEPVVTVIQALSDEVPA
jgi:hypothetical protein